MYIEDFKRLCAAVGFRTRACSRGTRSRSRTRRWRSCWAAKFYSLTYRLSRSRRDAGDAVRGLRPVRRVYGHHRRTPQRVQPGRSSQAGREAVLVCGNTASMLGEAGLGSTSTPWDRSTHYGLFDCGPSPVAPAAPAGFVPLSRETEGRDSPKGDEGGDAPGGKISHLSHFTKVQTLNPLTEPRARESRAKSRCVSRRERTTA